MAVDVLTVSTKGQIVLPAPIRKALSIKSGDRLAAYAIGDTVMLKPVRVPTEEDFKAWLDEVQAWAWGRGPNTGRRRRRHLGGPRGGAPMRVVVDTNVVVSGVFFGGAPRRVVEAAVGSEVEAAAKGGRSSTSTRGSSRG